MNKKNIVIVVIVVIVIGALYLLLKPQNNLNLNNNQTTNQQTMDNTTQGLKIETLVQGSGTEAKGGDMVTVNYTGMLTDGTVFDSNIDPKFKHVEPFSLTLGENRVIQGWELGLLGMKVGEKRKLTIPSELGYGAAGAGGGLIPPNATLTFEVELLKIN